MTALTAHRDRIGAQPPSTAPTTRHPRPITQPNETSTPADHDTSRLSPTNATRRPALTACPPAADTVVLSSPLTGHLLDPAALRAVLTEALAGTAIVLEFTAARRYLLTITHQPDPARDGAPADALAGWIERHITDYLTSTILDPANWHVTVTPTGDPAPASVRSAA